MSKPRARMQLVSRRSVLTGALAGAGTVTVASMLEACAPKTDDTSGGGETAGATPAEVTPPPSITPNDDFYITSCCGTPKVDIANWTLTFLDRGKPLATLDYAALTKLAGRDREHTLECISASPYSQNISNAVWHGLPLLEVFAQLGITVPAQAVQLKTTSEDGYTEGIQITDLDRPIWLVWRMNGVELPANHGYPARLLTPGRYGMKNPKWLAIIEFVTEPYLGYWEQYGWSDDATYQPNAFVGNLRNDFALEAGPVLIFGSAFAGSDAVVRVELTFDGQESWVDATLDYAPGPDIWVLWHYDWEATPGMTTIQVRCTTASGAMSHETSSGTGSLSGYNGSMEVSVTIS